jgi:hypothetical protein
LLKNEIRKDETKIKINYEICELDMTKIAILKHSDIKKDQKWQIKK